MLSSIPLGEDELPGNKKLAEELSHLGEIGSLLNPSEDEIDELEAAAASCSDDLFAATAKTKLESAAAICEKLSRRFTCTVANPPYMGSSSFNPFMSKWIKKNYPDVKSDLCTCFIERGFNLVEDKGYAAMVTMQSWMFLGSFEKMRAKVIDNKTIVSMAHLGPRAFDAIGGEVVNVTADVIYNQHSDAEGAYVRLVDINGSEAKRLKLVEAIQNPDCGWFYRRDADTFKQIPGTPIAYWASDGLLSAFSLGHSIGDYSDYTGSQNKTGDNNLYLRLFWEVGARSVGRKGSWATYSKGGDFRRWFGNLHWLVSIKKDAIEFYQSNPTSNLLASKYWFSEGVCYTMLTSGKPSFRLLPPTGGFDMAGPCICNLDQNKNWALGFLNCSIAADVLSMLNPTLNMQARDIKALPVLISAEHQPAINSLVDNNVSISKTDWDSFETSWDFKRHPLL